MRVKKIIFGLAIFSVLILAFNIRNIAEYLYPIKYPEYINKYSSKYDLSPYLVAAVIKTESNFNSNAKSNRDAQGLMQITPSTGEWVASEMKMGKFHVEMLDDPETNINMGCWYLNNLKKEFNGNIDLVLAAYNGGRGNVQKWLSNTDSSKDGKNLHYIPFKETDKYVKKVKVNYNIYKFLYGKKDSNGF